MSVATKAASEAAYKAKGEAIWKAHEWSGSGEPRDAHGRWVHGWSDIKSAADKLLASGKIDKQQHSLLLQAAARHSLMGRGIPKSVEGNMGKTLAYLAGTLRQDSHDAKNVNESKTLSRTARAVENVHAAVTGTPRTGAFAAVKDTTADQKHVGATLPGGGPKVVKKGGGNEASKKVEADHAAATESAPVTYDRKSLTDALRNLKDGESLNVPGGSMTRFDKNGLIGYEFAGKDGKKQRFGVATRAARETLNNYGTQSQGNAPLKSVKIEADQHAAVKVVRKAEPAKPVGHTPKVVKKMAIVKVTAENMRAGDIVKYGKAYGGDRTIRSITTDGNVRRITWEDGNSTSFKMDRVESVRRQIETTKTAGSKVTLDKAPTTKEFKAALDEALKHATTPDEIALLDPANRPMAKGMQAGHAQQLMYDLAVGKLNGVNRASVVKSDEDYRKEMSGSTAPLPDDAIEKHMQNVIDLNASVAVTKPFWQEAWKEMQVGYEGQTLSDIADKFFSQASEGSGIDLEDRHFILNKNVATQAKSDFDRQNAKYAADNGLVTRGKLDDVRDAIDAQTPHLFTVSKKLFSPEPNWVDSWEGNDPNKEIVLASHGNDSPQHLSAVHVHAAASTTSDEDLQRIAYAKSDADTIVNARADWHMNHTQLPFSDWVKSPEFETLYKAKIDGLGENVLASQNPKYLADKMREIRSKNVANRYAKEEKSLIDEKRGLEGTVKYDSGLPTWDADSKLEAQSWSDIAKRTQGVELPRDEHVPRSAYATALLDYIKDKELASGDHPTDTVGAIITDAAYDPVDGEKSGKTTPEALHNFINISTDLNDDEKAQLHAVVDKVPEDHLAANPAQVQRDYVPSFHTQSMVDDGVLYHKQEDAKLDPAKLKQALTQGLRQAAKQHPGVEMPKVDVDSLMAPTWSSVMGSDSDDPLVNIATAVNHMVTQETIDQMGDNPLIQARVTQRDEMLKSLDIVRQGLDKATIPTTNATVSQDTDAALRKILEANGGLRVTNSKPMQGKGTWTELKAGDMYLIQEGASSESLSEEEQVAHIKSALPEINPAGFEYKGYDPESIAGTSKMVEAGANWISATTGADLQAALDLHHEGLEQYAKRQEQLAEQKPIYKSSYLKQAAKARRKFDSQKKGNAAITSAMAQKKVTEGESAKRIEYVPWSQGGADSLNGAAPRSQRGRLTLEGYTPEEAAAKLKELGVVGDLETHTPAQAIFRSDRRTGDVSPLHPDYVRGEAQPPELPWLLTHGLTDRAGADSVSAFMNIANTGGLMSIADRFKRGIKTSTSSQVGDIGSGIDHVVFCAMDSGSTCGGSSPVRIGLRPDTAMRRDVLVSPTDFGGGKDRYGHYKDYRDKLEAQAGQEVGKTTIWTPLDPKARQLHINDKEKNPGSGEFDVAHQVRVEDMQVVAVKDQPSLTRVQKHLQALMESGAVSRIPDVILQSDWQKHIMLK